jgi:hypothetical protein
MRASQLKFTWGGVKSSLWLAALFTFCSLAYLNFNPRDWVETTIVGLPADTRFVCLVADGPQGPKAMEWYGFKLFPSSMHPNNDVGSYLDAGDPSGISQPRRQPVAWRASGRVGVLRGAEDGRWQIAWYNPPKSELGDRSVILGGGHWAARWQDADEIQETPRNLLSSMGFDYALGKLPEREGLIVPVRP